jgi:hypothetical protein
VADPQRGSQSSVNLMNRPRKDSHVPHRLRVLVLVDESAREWLRVDCLLANAFGVES